LISAYKLMRNHQYNSIISKIDPLSKYIYATYASILLDTLIQIYTLKPSENLQELILIENSKCIHPYLEVLKAYAVLRVATSATDYAIINRFESIYPTKKEQECVAIIGEFRDSAVLMIFAQAKLPIGLVNIGNT
jgi:hypothetical protein